jgi:magnesium-transporting ATPase (P-type)
MITGDHPITAIAIAKQVGIYSDGCKVLSGHELDRMTDEELHAIVEEVSIFARVTPEQKLRIVMAYQHLGHTVAMTGDGVNDTPAIKHANVGIAMGKTGTEVTKETADIVLQEDHFGSIVEGVKEGRTIIGNIRKALGCLLTGNLAEIIVTSAAVMVGLPIPLVPIQILLMNLLTDALPAMVLAVSPGNKADRTKRVDIVDKPLYQKVVTRGVLLGLGSLGLFALTLAGGAPVPVAQSVAFATLVAGQLIQTLNWRREGTDESVRELGQDRFMIGALGLSWLALFAALYVPPIARFFHTAPLSLNHWALVLSVAVSISLLSKPVLAVLSRRTGTPAGAIHTGLPSYAAV